MDCGYMKTNGQTLYYEVHGKGDPLLLIIGLGTDASGWMRQVPELSKHFRTIIFDNRDSGRSTEATAPYSIKEMAEDTAGFMEGLGLDRAHVMGGSMGGAIAQELVIAHPEKVDKLILACTMGDFATFQVSLLETLRFIRLNDTSGSVYFSTLIYFFMTHCFLKNDGAVNQMINIIKNAPFPQSTEAFCRQVDAIQSVDTLDRLYQVVSPTLVLVGDEDILTPPWGARKLAELIPNAELQIIKGGAHAFFWEIPDKVNTSVINFLKE